MRISDWSSDVCSSDLLEQVVVAAVDQGDAHRCPRQRARRPQAGEAAADDDDVRQVAARVPAAVHGASRSRGWRNDAGSRVAKQPMVAAGGRGAVPAARDARHTRRFRQALSNPCPEPAMSANDNIIPVRTLAAKAQPDQPTTCYGN